MSQSLKFKVHGVSTQLVDAVADIEGEKTAVKVPALVVELVSADGTMHPTLRFRKDLDQARKDFVPGAEFVMTLTPAEKDAA